MCKARSGSVLRWGAFALAVVLSPACQKAEETKAPAPAAEPSAAADPAAALTAEGVVPEPEVGPCKNCSIDTARRVRGSIQTIEKCAATGESFTYPLKAPTIEVVSGEQAGRQFALTDLPETLEAGAALSVKAPEDAKPEAWQEARLVLQDSAGHSCASFLKVLH